MAEGIVSDAVGRILEALGSRAFQEIQLASGVKDEILKLKDTVGTINCVLEDAEQQFNNKKNDRGVRDWLGRLKDAAYDADDLLDDFYTQFKLNKMVDGNKLAREVRMFFSKSNQIAYSLKMGLKIKAIRERLDHIKNDERFLLFKPDTAGKGVNYNRETHSFVREEDVIGREDDKKEITQLLLDSNDAENNNKVPVISIVGMGGVGKTTLVQSIYNVEEVKTHFQLRLWVCVSDDFTLITILQKILKSSSKILDELQESLRQEIDGKKYLLILDDVWNDNLNKWLELETLLRNGAKGSKILATTRGERVAKVMSKPPLIYDLSRLPQDKSWSLFTKIAFGEQGKEPKDPKLVVIGKEIVAKCAGVPLAIKTIGRLIYSRNKEDWLSFRDNELSKITQEEGDILPILKLSYDHLSSPLKQCFAYCALFPKDYEFEKDNLIQLWMAQGFLSTSTKNQCLEDVGNKYFMDLLSGSFFQDFKENDFGIMTWKMHDLMHDLAQSVAGSECKMVSSNEDNVDERCRHISFAPNLYSVKISTAMLRANRSRTILPLCDIIGLLNKFDLNTIFSNFRCLRTLNLSNLGIIKVPTSIGKLKHLRYLNLSQNPRVKELPDSMSKLINLQTLDLFGCESLEKLPRDMRKMVSLQYVKICRCYSLTSMPRGLGELTGLRSLPLFVVGKRKGDRKNDALRELKGLNKLRGSVTIVLGGNSENVNMGEANLEAKEYLESISLKGQWFPKEMTVIEGLKPHPNLKELSISGSLGSVMFSGCMSSFTSLTEIRIISSRNFRSITPLDQLPSLQWLYLSSLRSVEYISESAGSVNKYSSRTSTFFPSLKKLQIGNCEKLKGWWNINDEDDQVTIEEAERVSFPCLSQLDIGSCPMFTCMPLYPTLEKLYLYNSSTKALQQTMMMKMKTSADLDEDAVAVSTSYSAGLALFNLKSLWMGSIDDLESLPELLQRVSSLVELVILRSPRLISQLPQCITYLSSLENLTIEGCDQLDFLEDDDKQYCQWQGLRSLRYLTFRWIDKMECLPKWIYHVTTLQHLEIRYCPNLMALPEILGMQLQKLEIFKCPHLNERCGNKAVDWPKIAHIPNIRIDQAWIQLEGHYRGVDGCTFYSFRFSKTYVQVAASLHCNGI